MTAAATSDGIRERPQLVYPFENPPLDGKALEVAPGVRWIRMPLGASLAHINLWAIEDGEGWAVVDSGLHNDRAVEVWRALAQDGLEGRPVTLSLITHMHPDHVGMADWLANKYGCSLWMTALEYMTCRAILGDRHRDAPADGVDFYRAAGWNPEALLVYRERFGSFGRYIKGLPESYRRLSDGQTLVLGGHAWRVLTGSGHSPEHACFYCAQLGLFISGDQVLPRISSNVSVFPTEPKADPLALWLASIAKIKLEVPDDVLVLPAHNEPFRGLHARLDRLVQGHLEGLQRLSALLDEPKRVVDVFGALFARTSFDEPMVLGLATGEALAHLNYLFGRGEATVESDPSGVDWYQRIRPF